MMKKKWRFSPPFIVFLAIPSPFFGARAGQAANESAILDIEDEDKDVEIEVSHRQRARMWEKS